MRTGLPDLLARPGLRLGYVGALNYRIDFELLAAVADRFPGGMLVLVGDHAEADADPAFQRLAARPNVQLLGHRPPGELAALIAHLDVCLIPFVVDEWFVQAAQPLKTFEYLALRQAGRLDLAAEPGSLGGPDRADARPGRVPRRLRRRARRRLAGAGRASTGRGLASRAGRRASPR